MNRRPPPSPLGDFLDRFMNEVVLPRTDEMAESLTDWFDRMIANAEAQQRIQSQPGSVKNTTPRGTRSKRSGGKAPPKDRGKAKIATQPRGITAYYVLGVDPKAPQEVLSAAHKALARLYHPDVSGRYGTERMKTVNQAWELVKDPDRRRKYDKEIGL